MFEFVDAKLGKIKVVNITEARASIASIMNDLDCNYVITKNNKPIRVIVNYDSFKKNQSNTASKGTATKASESKVSLKGILESREKDLKQKEVLTTPPEPEIQDWKLDDLEEGEPKVAAAPEETQEGSLTPVSEEATLSTNGISSKNAWETQAPDEMTSVASQSDESSVEDAENRLKSKEEYFKKYSKLYAGLLNNPSVPAQPKTFAPETPFTEDGQKDFYEPASFLQAESDQPMDLPEPPAPSEKITEASPVNFASIISKAEQTSREISSRPQRTSHHDDLPSIQDLLRELENEKLSGE